MINNNEEPLEARDKKINELEFAIERVDYLLKFILNDDRLYEEEGWGKAPAGTQELIDALNCFVFSDELKNFYMNQQTALKEYRKQKGGGDDMQRYEDGTFTGLEDD